MSNLRFVITCLFCFIFAFGIGSQITISGRVVDQQQNPLFGVNVIIKGTLQGDATDHEGYFEFSTSLNVPFELQFSYTGFKAFEMVISESVSDLNIILEHSVLLLDEIIVSASRKKEKVQEAPAAISILTDKKIESDAAIEPMLSMRNLNGVDVAQYSVDGGHVNLRGRSAVFQTETFVMADYRNIVIPSFAFLAFGQHPIDMLDLDRIEVVKGPGSALYGPGVEAGIVHFLSKDPFLHPGTSVSITGGNRSQFGVSFRHAGVTNGKWGYKITGQYRRAMDFDLDPDNPVHAARLNSFVTPITSSLTGEAIDAEVPDYQIEGYGMTGTLVYKPDATTSLTAVAGIGRHAGIFRTSQGEGFSKAPRPFAQIRLQSKGFYAQGFWSYQTGKDLESFLYATGKTTINKIHQIEGQLQYNFHPIRNKLELTFGGDYRLIPIDTEGTIHGRFEDMDDYSILGFYSQAELALSKKLDFVGAARVDRFDALDETSFSPRAGLVFKLNPSQTFRMTWNRAIGAPTSLNLFADIAIANTGTFLIWLNNGVESHSYDNRDVYNFVTGSTHPGTQFPLAILYGAVTSGLAASGAFPPALVDYLNSVIPSITGATNAVPTSNPITRPALKLSSSNMFELGYNGVFEDRLGISIDVYYNIRKNNITAPVLTSPFVVYPTAGSDLAGVVSQTLDPGILGSAGLSPEALAGIYQSSVESFTLNDDGSPALLGLISSDNSPSNVGTLDFAYLNLERLDYWGVDIGMDYFLKESFSIFANASWLSQGYWEELTISGTEEKTEFSLNVPDTRVRIGANYIPDHGFFTTASLRYNSDWQSVNGMLWSGEIDQSVVVDAGIGYTFENGLRLNLNVTNVFNEDYVPIYGAPVISRLMLARATYKF